LALLPTPPHGGPSDATSDGGEVASPDGAGLSATEKREALARVLGSNAFLRAGQLCNFLRYISDMEIAGRASELSEYLIGVEALGRPPGYSTADDSSVRRRAHALRQKLDEVYASELATATVRIDLPKGSYVPHFVRVKAERPLPATPLSAGRRPSRAFEVSLAAAGCLAGGLAAVLMMNATGWLAAPARTPAAAPTVPAVLAEAWGPLARSGANVLICLAAPPHLVILPYPEEGPLPPNAALLPPLPHEPAFREWYRQYYPLEPTQRLAIHRTTGAIHLGDVNGLVTALRTLDRMGAEVQVVAEKNMGLPAQRGRNLIFFGNPEFSFAASKLLDRTGWTVDYDTKTRQRVVRPRSPASTSVSVYAPVRDALGWLYDVFGLVTVFPSAGSPETDPLRTVVISCTNDSGCQGAMEFFSSASQMQKVLDLFRGEGLAGFPPAYQIIVRTRVQSGQTISADYADHQVLR
jgi:hypothetical protein